MSIASNKRRVFGIKIPDIFLRNDDNDSTTGQVSFSKAGTVAVVLTGSGASIKVAGTGGRFFASGPNSSLDLQGASSLIYIANSGGTVGTISWGAGNALTCAIGGSTGTLIDL